MHTTKRQSTEASILIRACAIVTAACSLACVCVPLFAADPAVKVSAESRIAAVPAAQQKPGTHAKDIADLKSKKIQKKTSAIRKLGSADDRAAVNALLAEYRAQKDATMQRRIVESLGNSIKQDALVVPALEAILLSSATPTDVRRAAVQSLSLAGGGDAVEVLGQLFANDNEELGLRLTAGAELGLYLQNPSVFAALEAALEDKDPRIREQAVCSLGSAFDDDVKKKVKSLLEAMRGDADQKVSARAAQMLELMNPKQQQ